MNTNVHTNMYRAVSFRVLCTCINAKASWIVLFRYFADFHLWRWVWNALITINEGLLYIIQFSPTWFFIIIL